MSGIKVLTDAIGITSADTSPIDGAPPTPAPAPAPTPEPTPVPVPETAAVKRRRISDYSLFRGLLKARGIKLGVKELSRAWGLANNLKEATPFIKTIDSQRKLIVEQGGAGTSRGDIISQFDSKSFDAFYGNFYSDLKRDGRLEALRNEAARGDSRTRIPDPVKAATGKGPTSVFASVAEAVGVNEDSASNMGVKNPVTGQFRQAGSTVNAGGGRVDTQVGSDAVTGYVITQGPQSTVRSTQALRAKFPIAGSEDVQLTAVSDETSNDVFEAFSWVEPAFGLGPKNSLHLLNMDQEEIRYMQPMALPRTDNPAHGVEFDRPRDKENKGEMLVQMEIAGDIGQAMQKQSAAAYIDDHPMEVVPNSGYGNNVPDLSGLPRDFNKPYRPTREPIGMMFPVNQPAGVISRRRRFEPKSSGWSREI